MHLQPENLISRLVFDANELVSSYPPQFHHPNKQILYDYASPAGCGHRGQLTFTRWRAAVLPTLFRPAECHTVLEVRQGFYGYEPPRIEDHEVDWYVNFADRNLFGSYGMGVFAQDEIQVAEHPVLGSLREALNRSEAKPLTSEKGVPTPILIAGAERRCSVDTSSNEEMGKPNGLYGRQFAIAQPDTILKSTSLIDPPTITNLIAMEAPTAGRGIYTEEQINHILSTAFTGLSAAHFESNSDQTVRHKVTVHTGFWGCGAYGGNRILMVLLQLLAANLSGLDRIVVHSSDRQGLVAVEAARSLLRDLLTPGKGGGWLSKPLQSLRTVFGKPVSIPETELMTSEIVARIQSKEFKWGVSDGN